MRRTIAATLCLMTMASARAGATPPAADAEAEIKLGIALRKEGKDAEALEAFRRAFRRDPSPRARAQIALAEQALGQSARAEEDLIAALDGDDPWIQANKVALDKAAVIIRTHLGSVEIVANVSGGTVTIDGAQAGVLPLAKPLRATIGNVLIEVRALGHLPQARTVIVKADRPSRESFMLVPAPAQVANGSGPPPLPPKLVAPQPAPREPSSWPWLAAGGGGVGLGFAVAALAIREGAVSEFNSDACLLGGRSRIENCRSQYDAANSWRTVSIISFIVGGLLGAGAIGLFVGDP